MHRPYTPAQRAFADEVQAFVRAHWRAGRAAAGPLLAQWWQALRDRGWTVPHWPAVHGGKDWDALQMLIWQNACLDAGAPLPDAFTVSGIGPLLLDHGTPEVAQQVAGIRALQARWCLARAEQLLDPAALEVGALGLRLASAGQGLRLDGVTGPVVHGLSSQWALCEAQVADAGRVLLGLELGAEGVHCRPLPTLDEVSAGQPRGPHLLATLSCDAVQLPRAAILCEGAQVDRWLAALAPFAPALSPERLAASAIAVALDELRALEADQPDADTRRQAELTIRQTALAVLEHRLAAADPRSPDYQRLELMRRQQGLALSLEIADAQAQALGYYLLPFQAPELSHNEGPIGPPLGREQVARMLSTQGLIAGHDPLGEEIGQLAALLGVAGATNTGA